MLALPKAKARASVVCVHQGKLLTIKLQDPSSGSTDFFVPGGTIEPGETPAFTAVRETYEETGYEIELAPDAPLVSRYPYCWDATDYDCTTHWFKANLKDPDAVPAVVNDATYHRGVVWLPLEKVEENFGFHAEILAAVKTLLGWQS